MATMDDNDDSDFDCGNSAQTEDELRSEFDACTEPDDYSVLLCGPIAVLLKDTDGQNDASRFEDERRFELALRKFKSSRQSLSDEEAEWVRASAARALRSLERDGSGRGSVDYGRWHQQLHDVAAASPRDRQESLGSSRAEVGLASCEEADVEGENQSDYISDFTSSATTAVANGSRTLRKAPVGSSTANSSRGNYGPARSTSSRALMWCLLVVILGVVPVFGYLNLHSPAVILQNNPPVEALPAPSPANIEAVEATTTRPVPIGTISPRRRTQRDNGKATTPFDLTDCPNVSYEWQRELGCPMEGEVRVENRSLPKNSRRTRRYVPPEPFDLTDCPNFSYEWQRELGCPDVGSAP